MRLSFKCMWLIAGGFCLCAAAFAQQTFTIKGIVFRKSSTGRVSQALINDLNNKTIMMSDDLGMFSINVSQGDTLLITRKEFTPERIIVAGKEDIAVYLQPVIELNQVTIKGETKKQELNDVMQQYRSKGVFYNGKSLPLLAFLNSPITGFYNLFGKEPARERRFAAYAKGELEANEINRRYTKELVQRITKASDEETTKFMLIYTPSYQDIREWNDYQLITYIKKNYNYYLKHKNQSQEQLKMQKLN